MNWTDCFNLVGIKPGRMVVPGHGTIDFSNPSLPVELVKSLFENDFSYLSITPLGLETLYPPPPIAKLPPKPVSSNIPVRKIRKRKA